MRKDEAAAAAREEENERRMQEYDSERRLAILRGERPPSPPPDSETTGDAARPRKERHGDGHKGKRRKLAGEDDTERDIRFAREDAGMVVAARERMANGTRRSTNAPLHDHDGHINLFPVDAKAARKAEKNAEVEAEKQKKNREYEDQYTMRFSNAAGREGLERPWYANKASASQMAIPGEEDRNGDALVETKDVWGRPDPKRRDRDTMRASASDPLAFMKKAQVKLKDSDRDRQKWKEDRDREAWQLEKMHRAERRERRRRDDEDDLEGFSLDAPIEKRGIHRHESRNHRHRSRSRERDRKSHRRHRSRSPDAGRHNSQRHHYRERRHDRYDEIPKEAK